MYSQKKIFAAMNHYAQFEMFRRNGYVPLDYLLDYLGKENPELLEMQLRKMESAGLLRIQYEFGICVGVRI